jgi:insertion element IS1 protein InsB
VNPHVGAVDVEVAIRYGVDSGIEVEADEQWSYVYKKGNQQWLWYAIDKATGIILAYVIGKRSDNMCERLMEKLSGFRISRFYTDDWKSYSKFIPWDKHTIGKKDTQKIENKNLNLRTRIKRLARKTICFSKSEQMHRIVIGLFINRYCFLP